MGKTSKPTQSISALEGLDCEKGCDSALVLPLLVIQAFTSGDESGLWAWKVLTSIADEDSRISSDTAAAQILVMLITERVQNSTRSSDNLHIAS